MGLSQLVLGGPAGLLDCSNSLQSFKATSLNNLSDFPLPRTGFGVSFSPYPEVQQKEDSHLGESPGPFSSLSWVLLGPQQPRAERAWAGDLQDWFPVIYHGYITSDASRMPGFKSASLHWPATLQTQHPDDYLRLCSLSTTQ